MFAGDIVRTLWNAALHSVLVLSSCWDDEFCTRGRGNHDEYPHMSSSFLVLERISGLVELSKGKF